jgi:uncharacterized membrane protein
LNPDGRESAKDRADRPPRIWEIDFLRGLSIILMVIYHLLYDLSAMAGYKRFLGIGIDLFDAPWLAAQFFFAGLFVVLSGVSSTLTRSNRRRGLMLLGVALLITAVTYVYDPAAPVHFGILHCLAVSILLYGGLIESAKPRTLAAAAVAVIAASVLRSRLLPPGTVDFNWLLPLGVTNGTYASVDYFPLLPWLGIFLAGTALGKTVYARRLSLIRARMPVTFVNWAGRRSLLIYIVHQPVLLGALYLLGIIRL